MKQVLSNNLENKRSILENPKVNHYVIDENSKEKSLLRPFWRKRIKKLYESLIPSHIGKDKQIWLNSLEEIEEFIIEIKKTETDLSHVEYVFIPVTISKIYDIIDFFSILKKKLPDSAKIIYSNYNWKWGWVYYLTSFLGITVKSPWGNFCRDSDLDCFVDMAGWENFQKKRRYILPFELKYIGTFFDNIFSLPILRGFTLNTVFVARKSGDEAKKDYSVTILVPCKNEESNIEAIVKRTPKFGKSIEMIFINDKSTDSTEEKILEFKNQYLDKNVRLVQGRGLGKGEAIRTAMNEASGDICMILDADLAVIPEDLPQFYEAISKRRADFLHGTRLVYPQESGAMRPANVLGNIGFSLIFSFIMDQRVTDTLCGTKVFWRRDWAIFEEMKEILGNTDVWGDYNLIFGASRFCLKVGELPVRYYERLEGVTKMNKRIRNGLIMLRVAWHALWTVKFIG